MIRKIRSPKKLTINQTFFFNGSKLVMNVTDGVGTVEFDESAVNSDYLEAAILSKLHLEFIPQEQNESTAQEEETTKPISAEALTKTSEGEQKKPEKKTTTKKKITTRKRSTRTKKK